MRKKRSAKKSHPFSNQEQQETTKLVRNEEGWYVQEDEGIVKRHAPWERYYRPPELLDPNT